MPEPITPPNFDDVRWKLAEEMTDQDLEVLLANKDKLNDEEKAAFSELLQEDAPLDPNDPLSQAIDDATKGDTTRVAPENPVIPEAAAPVIPPVVPDNVVTQDKLDSYIEGKRKEWEAEGKTKEQQNKAEEQLKFDLFKQGEVPDDWNAAVNKFAPAIIEATEKRILEKLEKQNKEFADNQEKIKTTQQEIYQRFESEFATLSKNKLIPDPKENPEEYKKTHDAIIKIGDENGKNNVTDAYKLWSIIPVEHGGGFQTGSAPINSEAKMRAQKEAAGKIGKGSGSAPAPKKGAPSWASVHTTSMDDLIDARLSQS